MSQNAGGRKIFRECVCKAFDSPCLSETKACTELSWLLTTVSPLCGALQPGQTVWLPPPTSLLPYLHPLGHIVQLQLREGLVEVELQPCSRPGHRAQGPCIF